MHSSHCDKIKFGEQKTEKYVALQAARRFMMTFVKSVCVRLLHASPPCSAEATSFKCIKKSHYSFQNLLCAKFIFQNSVFQNWYIYFLVCQWSFPHFFWDFRLSTSSLRFGEARLQTTRYPMARSSSLFLAPDQCRKQNSQRGYAGKETPFLCREWLRICFAFERTQRIFSG